MEVENKVSVWAGSFSDEQALRRYVEEVYDEEEEVSSAFWEDFKIDYLDNQFQEVEFFTDPIDPAGTADFSYAETFMDDVTSQDLTPYNALIIAYDFEYDKSVAATGNVKFLGSFDYQK